MTLGAWSYFILNKLLVSVSSVPDCEGSLFHLVNSSWACLEIKFCQP